MIRDSNLPITMACSVLEINRSNYYNWLKPPETNNEQEVRDIIQEISLEFLSLFINKFISGISIFSFLDGKLSYVWDENVSYIFHI